jgi:hypothetical protein
MEIIDRNYAKLPLKRKVFLFVIGFGFLFVGLFGYIFKLMTVFESLFIIFLGIIYTEIIKLTYRVEKAEKKKK